MPTKLQSASSFNTPKQHNEEGQLIGDLAVFGKIAGLGGIALFVFMVLFRELIRKEIFPKLGRQEAYRIIKLFLCLTFAVAVLGIGAWVVATRTSSGAGRPYVFPVTAFWRNDLNEAVVQFQNSGSSPSYHNRTQIEFFATSSISEDQRLDWEHLLPALSDNTLGPGGMYNTPVPTRLGTVKTATEDVMAGKAVAYMYGIVRFRESPDAREDRSERFCFMFDANRSQTFFGCPAPATR